MDLSGLRQENLFAWIPFDDDTEVLLAYVDREELRQIRREATTIRMVGRRMAGEMDSGLADRLLGRRAVKDWRALPGRPGFTVGGATFPYSPENCDFLMERFNEFADFVNEKAAGFAYFVERVREEEAKK